MILLMHFISGLISAKLSNKTSMTYMTSLCVIPNIMQVSTSKVDKSTAIKEIKKLETKSTTKYRNCNKNLEKQY